MYTTRIRLRKTILRETDIYDILTMYEGLSQTTIIAHLQFNLLEIGTLNNASLSPEYFDCLPALTEIEIQAEQNDPPICINFSSFLDESICSVPDLEELPNPDMTEIPSFLGQNDQTRDCGRLLWS